MLAPPWRHLGLTLKHKNGLILVLISNLVLNPKLNVTNSSYKTGQQDNVSHTFTIC